MKSRIKKISLLICDVDGVLTDSKIIYDSDGREIKNFHVQDGLGLILLRKKGIKLAIISARESKVVRLRAENLGMDYVYVGEILKERAYDDLLKKSKLYDENICFVGDDLTDLAVLKRVGFAVAVKNAVQEIKNVAHYVTKKEGGQGAVREVSELILRHQGFWPSILKEMS